MRGVGFLSRDCSENPVHLAGPFVYSDPGVGEIVATQTLFFGWTDNGWISAGHGPQVFNRPENVISNPDSTWQTSDGALSSENLNINIQSAGYYGFAQLTRWYDRFGNVIDEDYRWVTNTYGPYWCQYV